MRSTTLTSFVPRAVETGRFDLRPNCYVREITLRPDGKASGVIYIDENGHEVKQEANAVVLCLGAIKFSTPAPAFHVDFVSAWFSE